MPQKKTEKKNLSMPNAFTYKKRTAKIAVLQSGKTMLKYNNRTYCFCATH